MTPILFPENFTTWTTNGIGRLSDAIACKVTEERNGKYELELTYPTTGKHYSEIGIRKIIVVVPSQGASLQPFRIYRMSRPIHGKVKINAAHISNDLTKYVSKPFSVTASSGACATTLGKLITESFTSCPFTVWTDVTTAASYTQKIPSSIKQRLGGIEGSVLDQFGGEYEFDGLTIKLHAHRGTATNYVLRYGKNITDVNQEENIAETASGVIPFWSDIDGEDVIYGTPVYSSHRSEYSTDLLIPLDLSEEWENKPTEQQLATAATVYVNKDGFGIPKVSIKVSFVDLAKTEEYKDFLPLQNVKLCDTVKVQFEALGIDTTAKVVETVYDVLADRYDSVQIGTLKSTLSGTITDYEASMAQSVYDTGKRVYAQAGTQAQDLVNNATAWLTSSGGYVLAVKNNDGSWKELLFLDSNDPTEAHNVLRINERGIGFSSAGVGGPYTQAWTLDGRLVIGGTNVPSITVYDSQDNVIFQASSSAIIWNAQNSSMSADGTITAENAVLTGGSLEIGGSDSGGAVRVFDENDNRRGLWNKSGFRLYDGNGNIIFEATSDVSMTGSLHTSDIDISGAYISYQNGAAYIDFDGSGAQGGVHIRGDKAVFSVNDIGTTGQAGGQSVSYGVSENANCFEFTNGLCTTVRAHGLSGTYTLTDGWGTQWTFEEGLLTSVT